MKPVLVENIFQVGPVRRVGGVDVVRQVLPVATQQTVNSTGPDFTRDMEGNIQADQGNAVISNEGENRLVKIKIVAPVGIPMSFLDKGFLGKLTVRPSIKDGLIGDVEHLHSNRQIGMVPEKSLQYVELKGVMDGIGVTFSDIYDPTVRQICDHFLEGDHFAGGRGNNLACLKVTFAVLEIRPLRCRGAAEGTSGQECQPDRIPENPFHFKLFHKMGNLRYLDFLNLHLYDSKMLYDKNPVHRKLIIPWYDSQATCLIVLAFMLLVFLFAGTGISVAGESLVFRSKIWLPVLLLILSGSVIVLISIRLFKRWKHRLSNNLDW